MKKIFDNQRSREELFRSKNLKSSIASSMIFVLVLTLLAFGKHHKDKPGEWVDLFNKKNLDDFTKEGGKATYRLKRGVIIGRTRLRTPNTFLTTKKQYADFELTFEVKVDNSLNSGVQIRSRVNPESKRYSGPQVEIEAGPGQAGYIYGESTGTGWISKNPRSKNPHISTHNHFKNNKWNKYRVIAKGPRIQTFVNGVKIEDLEDETIYKTYSKGSIGFQVHSITKRNLKSAPYLEVRWRKIKIKELK